MAKAKLLLVTLQNPGLTKYRSSGSIAAYLLGRRLSDYAVFVVLDGNLKQVVLTNADCHDIKHQIDKAVQQQEDNQ